MTRIHPFRIGSQRRSPLLSVAIRETGGTLPGCRSRSGTFPEVRSRAPPCFPMNRSKFLCLYRSDTIPERPDIHGIGKYPYTGHNHHFDPPAVRFHERTRYREGGSHLLLSGPRSSRSSRWPGSRVFLLSAQPGMKPSGLLADLPSIITGCDPGKTVQTVMNRITRRLFYPGEWSRS
jgi:hypothetical protein